MRNLLKFMALAFFGVFVAMACKQELEMNVDAVHEEATYDVTVAKDGTGNFTTVQAAVNAAPTGRTTAYKIYIKNGTYTEVVTVPSNKPFLQFIGQTRDGVIITFNNYNGKTNPAGGTFGTANSATVTINANDFSAANVSFKNSTGESPQALAINISGDRCAFKNCNFLGGQDTMLNWGDAKRQYFYSCYIEGTVDFIFGNARGWFEKCTINPKNRSSNGQSYITAANTTAGQTYGYVFNSCKITENTTQYFLGRPWQNSCNSSPRSNPKVVFLNTTMGANILAAGWSTWDACTVTSEITFAEYNSKTTSGAAVNTASRVSWSKQLTATQAGVYTTSAVLGTWSPCSAFADACTIAASY
jgi:pectin methylesterase-like acyl-CoA thioesterase